MYLCIIYEDTHMKKQKRLKSKGYYLHSKTNIHLYISEQDTHSTSAHIHTRSTQECKYTYIHTHIGQVHAYVYVLNFSKELFFFLFYKYPIYITII